MSAGTVPATAPIASLKARLDRLALDPRVRLVPDGAAIVAEIGVVLAAIDENDRRLVALEQLVARLDRATFGGSARD